MNFAFSKTSDSKFGSLPESDFLSFFIFASSMQIRSSKNAWYKWQKAFWAVLSQFWVPRKLQLGQNFTGICNSTVPNDLELFHRASELR